MRILANVNVPKASIEALRRFGHDVLWALECMASDEDFRILSAAQSDKRIELTNDKEFGDLAVHAGLPAECGVIQLRLKGLALDEVVVRTLEAIDDRTDWAGHFCVVDPRRIRMRPLSVGLLP